MAVWPDAFDETFGALFDAPDTAGVDAALLYLSTVAYPSDAHPLFDRPGRPWSRFGAEHGCRWRAPAPARLAARLATEPLHAWLTAYEERPDARWPTIAEEIRVLQLDTDFARRRELLLRNLVEPDAAAEWDDELGIA